MKSNSVTVGLPVKSLSEAKAWYTAFLGETKTLQPVPHIYEFEVIEGLWLQLVEDPSLKIGDSSVRFGVSDIKAERSRLLSIGIEAGEIKEIPGVVFLLRLADPFGNKLSLYQEI